jgi:hypothetical protein
VLLPKSIGAVCMSLSLNCLFWSIDSYLSLHQYLIVLIIADL